MFNKSFIVFIGLLLALTVNATNASASKLSDDLMTIKVEGISLNTPLNSIAEILATHGYHPTAETTYIKQHEIPGQRKVFYRIEIEGTNTLRGITYTREKSGGRHKSPPKVEELILESEILSAQEIYRIVCTESSAQTQTQRDCQPASKSSIRFNQGNVLPIGAHFAVSLSASATSTRMSLKLTEN